MKISSKIVIVTGILMSLTMSVFANQEVDVYEPKVERVFDLGEEGIIELYEEVPIDDMYDENEKAATVLLERIGGTPLYFGNSWNRSGNMIDSNVATNRYWKSNPSGNYVTVRNYGNKTVGADYRRMLSSQTRTSLSHTSLIDFDISPGKSRTLKHISNDNKYKYYLTLNGGQPGSSINIDLN